MKEKFKNGKGITLIALVITIIVLLILAGVTIATLMGDNGILTKATEAKEINEIADEKETIKLAIMACKTKYIKNSEIDSSKLQEEIENIKGKNKVNVKENGEYIFEVEYKSSKRSYIVTLDGSIEKNEIADVNDDTPGFIDGDGTERNPYKIESIEDLVYFSAQTNEGNTYEGKYITLEVTLDFNSDNSYALEESIKPGGLKEKITDKSGNGFKSIANFRGNFNGKNKYLKNIYIKDTVEEEVGLFKMTYSATLENLSITGEIIGNEKVAGFVGYQNGGIIRNCNNYALIENGTSLSGISNTGINGAIVENCNNYGRIEGKSLAYGIADGIGTVKNCNNYADIKIDTSEDENKYVSASANGIAAHNCIAYNCANYGNIFSREIDGSAEASGIGTARTKNCINYGDVYGEGTTLGYSDEVFVAGITEKTDAVSARMDFYIINCINYGNIFGKGLENGNGDLKVAGILAGDYTDDDYENNILNCYNYGNVSADTEGRYAMVAGIMGSGYNVEIRNCINSGKLNCINSAEFVYISGIAGRSPKIYSCYNLGIIEPFDKEVEKVGLGEINGDGYQVCENCYYLKSNNNNIGGLSGEDIPGKAEGKDEISSEEIINLLNAKVKEYNESVAEGEKISEWQIGKDNKLELKVD